MGARGPTTVPGGCMGAREPPGHRAGYVHGARGDTAPPGPGSAAPGSGGDPQPDPGGAGGCQPAATQGLVNWNFSTVGPTKKSLWTEEPRGALSSGLAIRAWRTAVWFGSPL